MRIKRDKEYKEYLVDNSKNVIDTSSKIISEYAIDPISKGSIFVERIIPSKTVKNRFRNIRKYAIDPLKYKTN